MRTLIAFIFIGCTNLNFAQFAPPAGEVGTTAIHKDSTAIVNWASEVVSFNRGLEDIAFPDGLYASYGDSSNALNYAEGNSFDIVSLGDLGSIVLTFPFSIRNGEGPDFAVFENSFSDDYLEFAHVEVSTDGERFVRFPSVSNIQTVTQTGTYALSDASLVHNLAGKYRQGYGTPFDLQDLVDSVGIDLEEIRFVRIVDVVGSIDPEFGTYDSEGHLINDPYKTDFESGGFDLDAVGVIHDNNPTAGIESFAEFNVTIYPNPTTELVNIQTKAEVSVIRLYAVTGNLVYETKNQTTLNLAALQLLKGIYILELQTETGAINRSKLVYH